MEGWIKLHRQIIENEFYFSEKFTKVQAWIDLLLLATHKERTVCLRGIEIMLKPGQLCYSQKSLAVRWNWNVKTVERYLNSLKKREMVDTKKTNITTIISIKKWFLYQTDGEQNTYQKGEQKDTKRETNKNDKNGKNDKKYIRVFKQPTAEEVEEYAKSINYQLSGKAFIDNYESKGWMVGTNKMKDWKAAVRTWQNREPKPIKPEYQLSDTMRMVMSK